MPNLSRFESSVYFRHLSKGGGGDPSIVRERNRKKYIHYYIENIYFYRSSPLPGEKKKERNYLEIYRDIWRNLSPAEEVFRTICIWCQVDQVIPAHQPKGLVFCQSCTFKNVSPASLSYVDRKLSWEVVRFSPTYSLYINVYMYKILRNWLYQNRIVWRVMWIITLNVPLATPLHTQYLNPNIPLPRSVSSFITYKFTNSNVFSFWKTKNACIFRLVCQCSVNSVNSRQAGMPAWIFNILLG